MAFKKFEPVETPWIVKKKRKRFVKKQAKMVPMKKTSWKESSMSFRKAMKDARKAFKKFEETT